MKAKAKTATTKRYSPREARDLRRLKNPPDGFAIMPYSAEYFARAGRASFESTRSSANVDAFRDMDGFDVDEELARFRLAVQNHAWQRAATLATNIDENLSRGGPVPGVWLAGLRSTGRLTPRKMKSGGVSKTTTKNVATRQRKASPRARTTK